MTRLDPETHAAERRRRPVVSCRRSWLGVAIAWTRPVLDDWAAGETARARDGFARLLPLIVFGLQPGPAWAVHKEVLVARGIIDDATVRAPARQLDPRARTGLREILAGLGVAQAG